MGFSTVFVGANSRVAQLVLRHWRGDAGEGGKPLLATRQVGGDLVWNMDGPPPALPEGPPPRTMVSFAGVTPRAGAALTGNTDLALAAQAAARAWGVGHCFHLSSAAVYGDPGPGPVAETPAPRPTGAYGAAKLAMEAALLAGDARDVTILRLGNVAGAGQPFDAAALPGPASLPLDRFADGTGPVRSFIGPRSLAHVLARLAALAAAGTPLPTVLNVAAPRPTPMADILNALGRAWHWRPAPGDAIQTVWLDTTALARLCPLPHDSATARALLDELRKDMPRR